MRGQEVFFGKGQCAVCHPAPYYTDNLMHNLQAERFFKPQMINGRMASADGPIKTFPLARHQGLAAVPARRPTADAGRHVEFFNLIQGLKLTDEEKKSLVAFLRVL